MEPGNLQIDRLPFVLRWASCFDVIQILQMMYEFMQQYAAVTKIIGMPPIRQVDAVIFVRIESLDVEVGWSSGAEYFHQFRIGNKTYRRRLANGPAGFRGYPSGKGSDILGLLDGLAIGCSRTVPFFIGTRNNVEPIMCDSKTGRC